MLRELVEPCYTLLPATADMCNSVALLYDSNPDIDDRSSRSCRGVHVLGLRDSEMHFLSKALHGPKFSIAAMSISQV